MLSIHKTQRATGLTLVELMIASVVASVALIVGGEFVLKSSKAMSDLAKTSHVATRQTSVMDRIVSELVGARFASMTPPLPDASPLIRFQKVMTSGSPPTYGNPIQIEHYAIEHQDKVDNDGDGLIDECGIRIWEDLPPEGTTPGEEDEVVVLSKDLTSDGLTFTRQGAILLIQLKMQSVDSELVVTQHDLQSGVRMRNSN